MGHLRRFRPGQAMLLFLRCSINVQNNAAAKLNNLRALDLKMKMPSESKPRTLAGIKAHHWSRDLISDNPKSGKAKDT